MRYAAVRHPPRLVGTDGVRPRMWCYRYSVNARQCIVDDVTA